jgi:hypothetical protein
MTTLNTFTARIIGFFRGKEAKQKYMFRLRSKMEEKKLRAFWNQKDQVQLDEIELQAFHNN